MEDVRMLVQEEGRAARNLVAFHVDLAAPMAGKAVNRKPPSSPRLLNETRMTKRSAIVVKASSRNRSVSTGRDKKSELQARYWAYLFGNLQRAVDELYRTCESDENVSECMEVILVLENFTKDFRNLIKWFKLKFQYETTPPPQRPNSLAWEVRKSSPRKVLNSSRVDKSNKGEKQSPVKKQLNFISDVKISTSDESSKASTNDSSLCNHYGLSFGDVNYKEHLGLHSCNNDSSCTDSENICHKQDGKSKENGPLITVDNTGVSDKREVELVSSDQSSQTETVSLQNTKAAPKPVVTLVKKPPQPVKPAGNSSVKASLAPLAVNKIAPNSSVRKAVPLSPTSSVPPRSVVPGRNVAAAAFVPSKKAVAAPQAKASLVHSKSTPNLHKSENIPNQPAEKESDDAKNSSISLHASVQSSTTKESSIQKSEVVMKDNENSKDVIKNNVKNDSKKEELKPEEIINIETKYSGDEKTEKSSKPSDDPIITDCNERTKPTTDINKNNLLLNGEKKDVKKGGTVVVNAVNNVQEKIIIYKKKDTVKKEKCDKCVMTDLPYIPQPKQSIAKVASLVRNKTVPSLVRKSSETLGALDSTVRSSAIITNKTLPSSMRKQPTVTEVPATSEKPAYAAVSKVFRSNTAIELRPKIAFNTRVHVVSKYTVPDKQSSTLQKGGAGSLKNHTQLKSCSSVYKSEQSLKKKSSVDEDGWETVKGRSRWRLTQSSGNIKARTMPASARFYLPSPATSLPALALATEDSESEDPKPAKLHKDQQNQEIARADKVKQQMSARSESEKSTGSGRRKSRDEGSERKVKSSMNERKKTNSIKVPGDLKMLEKQEECSSSDSKIDKYMDMLSSEDERINEEEIRKSMELYEKEKMLTKEIQDLEKAEIEVDTETEDAEETDGEAPAGMEMEEDTDCRITALRASYENVCKQLSWTDQMDTLEKLEKLIASDTSIKGISMAERISTLEQLEELVARHPGRALELHQKLSSPSRRRQLPDTIQRHRARQASAQMKREQLLQDKSNRMRELLNKVEEVKMAQAQLIVERKNRLAEKLKRAEENRASHLRSIQRKAHDEEEKLKEIAFINEMEAQNKRHDFLALCQEQRERLQGILDERQRRQEEKAAKEAAVEERRRIIEAERQDKLEKMQERRRKREERIGREQQEKEKERLELAREKARDREERLQALQAAQLATVEELQKKIQQKQFDSARRHEENIEHIRQRALESGALRGANDDEAPRLTPYETHKLCKVCNVLIESEVYLLSHVRGKAHQEAVKDREDTQEEIIVDAPPDKMDAKLAQDRERLKALRKRCKKIRSRMALRGEEYLAKLASVGTKKVESPAKGQLFKCLRDVDKLHSSQGVGQWPNNSITLLERNLGVICRILDKMNPLDQKVFRDLNGFTTLSNILNLALDIPKNMSPYLPPKCYVTTCSVYSLACINNPDNARFVFFSNKIALVLDLLLNRLNTLITDDYNTFNKSSANLPSDPVAGALIRLFALILLHSQKNVTSDLPDMAPRLQDIISYTVSVGVVDKLALYCSSVRDPVDNDQSAQFLLSAIELLTTLAQTKCGLVKGDPTQLVATLRVTELVGGVSMLYGMLLQQGAPPTPPPVLPPHTITLTRTTLRLLRAVAQLDLQIFQSVLGAEGMSLQLRHIASYLLLYCSHIDEKELLHQVIEVVGYFAVNHYDNQMMLQSGHMPTVLQQLCNLPFEYFSDPGLSCHLFPTLLACCHGNDENRAILEQELNYKSLEDFKQSEEARKNELIRLLK